MKMSTGDENKRLAKRVHMNTRILIASLIFGSSLVACSQSTQQAPGTMPGDMSQEEHMQAAEKHDAEAAKHEKHVETQSKGPQKMMHSKEVGEHSDVAEQHREAAEQAE